MATNMILLVYERYRAGTLMTGMAHKFINSMIAEMIAERRTKNAKARAMLQEKGKGEVKDGAIKGETP